MLALSTLWGLDIYWKIFEDMFLLISLVVCRDAYFHLYFIVINLWLATKFGIKTRDHKFWT
jgi:hypothetical protein